MKTTAALVPVPVSSVRDGSARRPCWYAIRPVLRNAAGIRRAGVNAGASRGTESLQTPRWREPDSNHRSRSCERSLGYYRRGDAGPISCTGSLSKGRLTRRRWSAAGPLSTVVSFSVGPMVRTRFPPGESQQQTGGCNRGDAPQTVELAKVNVQKLAAGYRASKVIGRRIVNNDNETIGKIDDLLVSSGGKDPYGLRRRTHAARLPGTRGRGLVS